LILEVDNKFDVTVAPNAKKKNINPLLQNKDVAGHTLSS
jgi:hypothetical protein